MAEPQYRYFLCVDSPLNDEIERLNKNLAKAAKVIKKFCNDVGATNCYGASAAEYKFDLARDTAVAPAWRVLRGGRGYYWYVPRKNTPEGKALAARVAALPPAPPVKSAINIIPGVQFGGLGLLHGNRFYNDYLAFVDHVSDKRVAVVGVLAIEDKFGGNPTDREIDVQPWMREIANWQLEKLKETGSID